MQVSTSHTHFETFGILALKINPRFILFNFSIIVHENVYIWVWCHWFGLKELNDFDTIYIICCKLDARASRREVERNLKLRGVGTRASGR
jgi:hypothetical protein